MLFCRFRQVAVGDIVLAVDGVKVGGRSLIEVARLFSGPSGTSIAIKLKRQISECTVSGLLSDNFSAPDSTSNDVAKSFTSDSSPTHPASSSQTTCDVRFRSLTVNVTRIDFSSDEERYVSWIRATEAERAAGGMGGWLLDRVAPRGSEMMRLWGTQLREHIQRTQMVDTIAAQARLSH